MKEHSVCRGVCCPQESVCTEPAHTGLLCGVPVQQGAQCFCGGCLPSLAIVIFKWDFATALERVFHTFSVCKRQLQTLL